MQGFGNFISQEISQNFVPLPNTLYRIVSAKQTSKALTVSNDSHHSLIISNYTGDASQKFSIIQQGSKFAFVVQSTQTALCIFQDNNQNGGRVLVDPGKHQSSWFEVARLHSGEYANRGYQIKTFAQGKCLDLDGGNLSNGTNIIQWEANYNWNQAFLIVPADQPLNNNPYQSNQGFNQGFNNNQGFNQGFNNNQGFNQGFNNNNQGFNQGFNNNQGFNQGFNNNNQGFNQGFNNNQGFNQGFNNNNQGFSQMQGIFKKNYTYALICSERQQKCLQIQNKHLVVADYQGLPSQKYTFEYDTQKKKYRIRAVANGEYLNGPGFFAGVDIKTEPRNNQDSLEQSWEIIPSKNVGRGYNFKSWSSHTLDVPSCDYVNGKRVQKHGFHGNGNQTFLVVEA